MSARKAIWNKKKPKSFSYSGFLGILFIISTFGYFVFILNRGAIEQQQLERQGIVTQAVVINEKNYLGNSPVIHQFSYSYEFSVNGKKYTGNTRDVRCRVGDTIKIKYVPVNPEFNTKLD